MIKTEIKRALTGKSFKLALVIGIAIAIAAAVSAISTEFYRWDIWDKCWINSDGTMNKNPQIAVSTLYRCWIGGNYSPFSIAFYYLLPILAALPFSWSLADEIKSGYRKLAVVRCGRMRYYFSKYIAAFISGALVVVIPLIINFIFVACFVPARTPDPGECIWYGVFMTSFCSQLFYTAPLLYDLLIIFIDMIFAGFWATLCLSLGFYIKNKAAVIILPYILLLLHQFLCTLISAYRFYIELSPFNFLKAYETSNTISGLVIFVSITIILLVSVAITYIRGKRDNVY